MDNSNPVGVSPTKIPSERRVLTWLRNRSHPYCWGQSDRHKAEFRQTSKRQLLGFFSSLRHGLKRPYLPRMTNRLMMQHFVGGLILYFQADGKYSVPETLICIDIDCHERGTYAGACACVNWLVDNGFFGLFWSRSTNGRGVHAYLRIDKTETNARGLDGALLEFERWLKFQMSVQKWDIEDIEVKGRPPLFDWGNGKYELLNLKMGSLAKLPVEALDRPGELMRTTVKGVDKLRSLGGEVPRDWMPMKEDTCTTYCVSVSPDLAEGSGAIYQDELEPPFTPDMRNREWPRWVEVMAKNGLQEENSLGLVVFELAKWLIWIELYDQENRVERTIELLQDFVTYKHNGFVTRINNGHIEEVSAQVERIVQGVEDQSAESKELFCRIRQKRDQGKYWRVISIAPALGAVRQEEISDKEYNCTTYSVSISTPSDEPVPVEIESRIAHFARSNRMQVRDGVYPIVRFARRLLNHLWGHKGSARIHRKTLAGWAGGVNPQNKYKKILRDLGVIDDWQGTYRSKTASSLYRMSQATRDAFEEHFQEQARTRVV